MSLKKASRRLRRVFAANLRAQRQLRNLSQEGLADRAGLHRTYVSSVERGERNVSIDNIERLSNALDIDPSILIQDADATS